MPGILTADHAVPDAQLMSEITCDEMLELASLGSEGTTSPCSRNCPNYGVELVVRSSWTEEPGTQFPQRPNPALW